MPLRICFLTAEMTPFAKAGGLADVSGALVKYLHAAGHDIRLFLPGHASIKRAELEIYPVEFLQDVPLTIGPRAYRFSVQTARVPNSQTFVYLIDCPAMFGGPAIYTADLDEYRRYLLFTHAALQSCQRMGFAPQILHCNDWHTAIGPLWLKSIYKWDQLFAATRSVFTIHNLGYQGVIGPAAAAEVLGGAGLELLHQEDLRAGRINLLRHGLLYADLLTTVSPTYAREIQTAEYGAGLDDTLRARSSALVGILNGVDYTDWDPRNDAYLPRHFGANQLGVKAGLKEEFLARHKLRSGERRPLLGVITRLAAQKGVDLRAALAAGDARVRARGAGFRRTAVRGILCRARAQVPGPRAVPSRLQRRTRALDRGRQRHVPDAFALRALRPQPDVQPALRHGADRAPHRWARRLGAALRCRQRHRHRHRLQ
jgi:starch synthase